ncbi:beta-lactamase family protein [Salipiger sp. P9]|uniref:serine hydrolase domain-containing protein n=1 Tax=Salipiger pentaromativorans TaxID=2943193 RepID=UPI002157E9B6|nr:serine hydrolase domain-containing protein [Salipiger pentaromativorans]MCR8547913.1 beta-lactamase family protein [Salipiger pentaromativorans]
MQNPAETHAHWSCADGREGATAGSAPVFPYWSFTKTVIALCALTLSETGKLDLDAPVTAFPATLRQLLTHTAGLPDYGPLPAYAAAVAAQEEPWPRERLVAAVMAEGPLFAPGQGWAYSNLGYMLAREEIERAAGTDFFSLFKAALGDPLGLDSIALARTRADFARTACPTAGAYHPGWVYHGCLTGTARDAARLLHALFSGALLSAPALAQMLEAVPLGGALAGRPWTECGYSLGLMNGRAGDAGRCIGHSGGGPGCVCAVYHFPDLDRPVTVASFADGHDEGVAEFAATRLARRAGAAPGAIQDGLRD